MVLLHLIQFLGAHSCSFAACLRNLTIDHAKKRVTGQPQPATHLKVHARCWPLHPDGEAEQEEVEKCVHLLIGRGSTEEDNEHKEGGVLITCMAAPEHLTLTQMKLGSRWGEGKQAVCASREAGCLSPRPRRSHALTTTCRRRSLSSSSTCCNRDCEETGKALVVVTIIIRSHRLVVGPEACASA